MKLMGRAVNPVLARELTERFRGPRAMIVLSIYLMVIGGIVVVVYRAESSRGYGFEGSPVVELAGIGQMLFESTLLLTMLLVLFLVPGFTAGSITGERERQTLLPLQVTLMRPIGIVMGKVAAAVAFTVLLIIATVPLLTLSYMIGGIRLVEIFRGLGIVLLTAFVVAVVSVGCSAWMRRVQTSTVVAYGLVVFAVVGSLGAYLVAGQIDRSRGPDPADPPQVILAANPLVALADVVGDDPNPRFGSFDEFGSYGGGGPLSSIRSLAYPDEFWGGGAVAFEEPAFEVGAFGQPVDVAGAVAPSGGPISLWLQYVLVSVAAVLFFGWTAARRLRVPAKTER